MQAMVVDDSRAMRMILGRMMRELGFEVTEATTGRDALERLEAGTDPDVVLVDWNMPEMTGIESLRAIRAAGSDVTFGFVTSEGSEEMRAEAAAAGAAFLIAKPFTADTFRDVLEQFVA